MTMHLSISQSLRQTLDHGSVTSFHMFCETITHDVIVFTSLLCVILIFAVSSDKIICFVWRNNLFCLTKSRLTGACIEIHVFSLRHFFDLVLRNRPIFKFFKFEIWHVCQKIRHVWQKIWSVGTPNWQHMKWRHFVIRSRWAPYNCPHSTNCALHHAKCLTTARQVMGSLDITMQDLVTKI